MGTQYDMIHSAFVAPVEDRAEPLPVWEPQEYESWLRENQTDNSADTYASQPGTAESEDKKNYSTSTAAQQQQWESYYSALHTQNNSEHQKQTETSQGQATSSAPPLPLAPPPQPPPPPDIASTSSWSSAVKETDGTDLAMEPSGFAGGSFYQQQQAMQDVTYPLQDQSNSAPDLAVSSTATPSANGSHNYGQTYSGYGAPVEPYAYGGPGYQSYGYGYLQQGNDSYSQSTEAYQNPGASYQAANSFQNTSPYADTASYQSTGTYYNAGVYQNTGAYQGTGYTAVAPAWSDGTFGSYGGYSGYPGYTAQDSAANVSVSQSQTQYQDYQAQWAEYYASLPSEPQGTETSGAPGTDAGVLASAATTHVAPTYASIVAHGASGTYATSNNQPPPPGTQPSWPVSSQPYGEDFTSQVSSLQSASNTLVNSWDQSVTQTLVEQQAPAQQTQLQQTQQQQTHMQQAQPLAPLPHFQQVVHYQQGQQHQQNTQYQQAQQPLASQYQQGHLQQQNRFSQTQSQKQPLQSPGSKTSLQQELQVSQGYQLQSQELSNQDLGQWRAGKLQTSTSSRMPQNLGVAMSTSGKMGSGDVSKPAYISVAGKAGGVRMSTDDVADAALQPGSFPSALRAYVERALSRCRDDAQKAACQDIMKKMITEASHDGSLFSKDWDTEPLFPLPEVPPNGKGSLQRSMPIIMKLERSPSRRVKSRWEPVPEDEEELEKSGRLQLRDAKKEGFSDRTNDKDTLISPNTYEKREVSWVKDKSSQQQTHMQQLKRAPKGQKRLRRTVAVNGVAASESESDEEEEMGGIHLGSIVSAETPEERKRRQSRSKRFDRTKELSNMGVKVTSKSRGSSVSGGSATARRATALQLAMSVGDGNVRAVEDIDWDALTVRGTCQEIEKRYLRLTSAPDPSTVRPEEVLKKALAMVQQTSKSYLYKCEQLKSIRQDLTVQRIRDELTVQVYETHARMALEAGDLPEYNQCQTQLKGLYAEGIHGCCNEFAAYSLLYIIFQRGNNRDLLFSMARLSSEAKKDAAVQHALAVREAVAIGNYHSFFRLYRTAPNLSPCLMDLHVEKMRFEALRCLSRAYRPSLSVLFIARALGFILSDSGEDKETEVVEECEEWLKAHGAQIMAESPAGELVMDTKASSTSLFMPEPEDVVPHGDANLALNDFFARA